MQRIKKHLLPFSGCFLAVVFIRAQTPELDSLAAVLPTLTDDTAKITLLVQLTNTLNSYDLEQAKRYGRQAVQLAEKQPDDKQLPAIQTALGRTFANLSQPDSALFYFNKAKAGFIEKNDQKGLAGVLSKMRWVQNFLGNYEAAATLAYETLQVYETIGDEPGKSMAFTYIGEALYAQEKYDEMIAYIKKAYDLQEQLGLNDDLAYTAQLAADGLLKMGRYEEALDYANESLHLRRESPNELNVALSLNTRGNVRKYLKAYEQALADYRESLAIARKVGFPGLQMAVLNNEADVYNRMEAYRRALPVLLQLKQMIDDTGEQYKAVENLRNIATSYAGLGRYDSAYFYQKLHTELGDSLLTTESNARVSELQTKYETAQKEATIAIQQSKIVRQEQLQWFYAGILGLLLVVAGLLFRGYRIKQRNNEVLERKNSEIALLLKEIHHRVKNNLQIIASLLNLQTGHIQDESALGAVREGKARVESMSLIHQRLYTTDNVSSVNLRSYLHDLGETVLRTFGVADNRIQLNYQVEALELDVDSAIPLGLIINELMTNALKHAFPNQRQGGIHILLKKEGDHQLLLTVSDNGVGQNDVAVGTTASSFGTSLVKMLSKKLKGVPRVETNPEQGTTTTILFEQVNFV